MVNESIENLEITEPKKRGHMEVVGEISDARIAELYGFDVPRSALKYRYIIYTMCAMFILCIIALPVLLVVLLIPDEFSIVPVIIMGAVVCFGLICLFIYKFASRQLQPHLDKAKECIYDAEASIFKNDFNISGEVVVTSPRILVQKEC